MSTINANPEADRALAAELVDRLNQLIEDEDIKRLIEVMIEERVSMSLGIMDHPTIQVGIVNNFFPMPQVGFLGLLNGLVGTTHDKTGNRMGYIQAHWSDEVHPRLIRFELVQKEKMDLAEFQSRATRTLLTPPLSAYEEDKMTLVSCALGLAGEVGEYIMAIADCGKGELEEELGDVAWYAAASAELLDLDLDTECEATTKNRTTTTTINGVPSMVVTTKLKHLLPLYSVDHSDTRTVAFVAGGYLSGAVGRYVEKVKKSVFHEHEISKKDLANDLVGIIRALRWCSESIDSDLSRSFALCIDKLEKRYPDGFDPEASQQRSV